MNEFKERENFENYEFNTGGSFNDMQELNFNENTGPGRTRNIFARSNDHSKLRRGKDIDNSANTNTNNLVSQQDFDLSTNYAQIIPYNIPYSPEKREFYLLLEILLPGRIISEHYQSHFLDVALRHFSSSKEKLLNSLLRLE